jgi:hypothetical protein
MSCLPFLRVLFIGILDRRGRRTHGYQSSWAPTAPNSDPAHLGSFGVEQGTHSSVAKTMKSRSEEDILLDDTYPGLPEQVIVKTTGYHVHEERIDEA